MRIQVRLLSLLFVLLLPPAVQAQQLAFPSAEGFGRFASGGRGGSVCKVTTLADSGAGSLRACLGQSGPRTIVFAVSGIITLTSAITSIPDHVTIACQSAPGQGVLIKGSLKFWNTENVIMRFCRLRSPPPVDATWAVGMSMVAPYVAANTMIFDHLSLGWYYDDMLGFTLPSVPASHPLNATVQWSIFSESTASPAGEAGGSKGATGGGVYNASGVMNVSWLYNLYSNVGKRTPHPGSGSRHQVVNQVLHNLNTSAFESIYILARFQPTIANIIGNWFRSGGPNTWPVGVLGCGWPGYACNATAERGSNIYLKGNLDTLKRPNTATGNELAVAKLQNADNFTVQSTTPNSGFPTLPSQTTAEQAFAMVMANVGAHKPFRDAIDQRAISDATNDVRRGACSPTPGALCFHYPTYAPGTVPPDTDNDGMPDSWETAHGLNPALASDGPSIAPNGYSNLENYLNTLAGDTVLTPPAGPVLPPTSCVATGGTGDGPVTAPMPALPRGPLIHVSKTTAHPATSCAEARHAATPYRTLNAGIACLNSGDTLVIHGQCADGSGAYPELLVGSVSGTRAVPGAVATEQPGTAIIPNGSPGRPTTLQAAPGAKPCLRGVQGLAYPGGGGMLTTFQGSAYLHVSGLSFMGLPTSAGGTARGIIMGEAHHLTIEHGIVAYGTVKAGVTSHHITLRQMDLRPTSPWCQWPAKSGGQPCPHNLYMCGQDHVIEQNRVDGAGHTGLQVSCEQGQVRNNVLRQNRVTNAGAIGIGVGCRGCQITSNLVIGAIVAGLRITGSDNLVAHNTIVGGTQRRGGEDAWGILWGSRGQVVNNLLLKHRTARSYLGTQSGAALDTGQVHHNVCDTGGQGNAGCATTAPRETLVRDPAGDFRLRPTSVSRGRGVALALAVFDLLGHRYRVPDVGAYAFDDSGPVATVPCPTPLPVPLPAPLPAPRNLHVRPGL